MPSPHSFITGTLFAALTAAAFAAAPEPGSSTLGKMNIDNGQITFCERETNPTLTASDGKTLEHLPPRTVVKMVLTPANGSKINVELWLPDAGQWNGRFLGLGNGGAAGHINPFFGGSIVKGFAVATTDMGTAPAPDSGNGNPEVWKDFGFRATHLMTLAAKQAIQAFYGRAPDYSYFSGGSTGGQQGVQEAQRYPEDYDGIAADVPALSRTPLHAYFLWNHQILTRCPFSESQEKAVIAAGNEVLASREPKAIAGLFISDPRCTTRETEAAIALARQKDPTLTDAHAEALRKLFEGPRHAVTGKRIFNGIPLGSTFDPARGNLYLFHWVFGAKKDLMTINFGEDIDTYTAQLGPYLNAENPDLSAFEKRGGKLILQAGAADSCVPYHAILDYYERVAEHFGSLEKTQAFCRLYLVPGMAHGGDGPGVNQHPELLSRVISWREKDTAPERMSGRRVVDGKVVLELPLFPYPAQPGVETAEAQPIPGPRGGVERIDAAFRPAAAQ